MRTTCGRPAMPHETDVLNLKFIEMRHSRLPLFVVPHAGQPSATKLG